MRIAVVCFDLSLKAVKPALEKEGHEVFYFIAKPEQSLSFQSFSTIPVLSGHLMIPGESELRTARQASSFSKISESYRELKFRMTGTDAVFKDAGFPDIKLESADRHLNSVKDIHIDPKTRKVIFEIENKGVESFDYLICESHILISQLLKAREIDIKQPLRLPKYIWASFGFDYELKKPLQARHDTHSFFLVNDADRASIVDNWYFCQMLPLHMSFWSYFPESQIHNPEFQDFYVERVRQIAGERLPFLQLKSFNELTWSTLSYDIPASHEERSKKRQILFTPNMAFWSAEQVEKHFIQPLSRTFKKMKLNSEAQL